LIIKVVVEEVCKGLDVLVVGRVKVLTGGMSVGWCTVFVEECGCGTETRGPSIAMREATLRET
jgi:hypothetical protein